jgi:histidine triad (HIT) family protein
MITLEQAKSLKEQILKQIESFPADKREEIKSYISSLNNEQLEEFLIKNKLIKPQNDSKEEKTLKGETDCIFCNISQKKIPSFILYEDKDYLATLEIKPFSIGHTLLIPKKHIEKSKSLQVKAFRTANTIAKKIIKKLGAESYQVNSSEDLGHAIINIIPTYKDEKISYERKPASKEELQNLAIKIGEIKKKSPAKKKQNKKEIRLDNSNIIKLTRRIP